MHLPEFTAFLNQQQLTKKTIRNYRSDISRFLTWVDSKTLDPEIFTTYKHHLQSQKIPRSTLARHLASLRQFAKFLNLPVNLDNPPLPLIPTTLKNFRSHQTKNRYKAKTVTNYLSDVKHYLHWAQNHA